MGRYDAVQSDRRQQQADEDKPDEQSGGHTRTRERLGRVAIEPSQRRKRRPRPHRLPGATNCGSEADRIASRADGEKGWRGLELRARPARVPPRVAALSTREGSARRWPYTQGIREL